jgi:hypothetical protein
LLLLYCSILTPFSLGAAPGDIIIPEISLENSTLESAVGEVVKKSVEADPRKQGVNVILKNVGANAPKISLQLKGQSVQSILQMMANLSGLKLVQDKGAYFLEGR